MHGYIAIFIFLHIQITRPKKDVGQIFTKGNFLRIGQRRIGSIIMSEDDNVILARL